MKSRALDGRARFGVAQELAQGLGRAQARGDILGARAEAGAPVQVLKLLLRVHAGRMRGEPKGLIHCSPRNALAALVAHREAHEILALGAAIQRDVRARIQLKIVGHIERGGHVELRVPAVLLGIPGECAFEQQTELLPNCRSTATEGIRRR